jgi:hypothetical protein
MLPLIGLQQTFVGENRADRRHRIGLRLLGHHGLGRQDAIRGQSEIKQSVRIVEGRSEHLAARDVLEGG